MEVDLVVALAAIDVVNDLEELLEHLLFLLVVGHALFGYFRFHFHHPVDLLLLVEGLQLPNSVADEGKGEEGIMEHPFFAELIVSVAQVSNGVDVGLLLCLVLY